MEMDILNEELKRKEKFPPKNLKKIKTKILYSIILHSNLGIFSWNGNWYSYNFSNSCNNDKIILMGSKMETFKHPLFNLNVLPTVF